MPRHRSPLLLAACATLALLQNAAAGERDALPHELGTVLCVPTGARYVLQPDDAVWAARMLVGEAGGRDDADNAAVLWCMLNSYMIRPVRERYPSFTTFIRAYSTPLQPWLRSRGALRRHRRRGTPLVEVEPGHWQLARHVRLQQRPWRALPAGARALVLRVFTGRLPSVCGNATQFCSTRIYFHDRHGRWPTAQEHDSFARAFARGKRWRLVTVPGASPGRNRFFEELRFDGLGARPAVRVLLPEDDS